MFYYLNGTVAHIEANTVVIDISGIGFKCCTSMRTISHLEKGRKAKLYTYCYIKEDVFDIYGFYDENEKRSFELLISVSGVGPKAAISILSSTTAESLAMAIVSENDKILTSAPGVGKRIAQRIILELKDKISKEIPAVSKTGEKSIGGSMPGGKLTDAAAALAVLGYTPAEITNAMRKIDVDALTVEEIIKEVLKTSLK